MSKFDQVSLPQGRLEQFLELYETIADSKWRTPRVDETGVIEPNMEDYYDVDIFAKDSNTKMAIIAEGETVPIAWCWESPKSNQDCEAVAEFIVEAQHLSGQMARELLKLRDFLEGMDYEFAATLEALWTRSTTEQRRTIRLNWPEWRPGRSTTGFYEKFYDAILTKKEPDND